MNTITATPGVTSSRVSAPLSFKVSRPLSIGADHQQTLGANYIIAQGRPPQSPAPGSNASHQRQAQGGVPPYTYSSSNTNIAVVDINTGKVVATGAGTARITVTDRAGGQASYNITFRGVVRLVYLRDNCGWFKGEGDPSRPDFFALTRTQMQQFWLQYKDENTGKSVPQILGWRNSNYWSRDNIVGGPTAYAVNFNQLTPNFNGFSAHGGTVLPAVARLGW